MSPLDDRELRLSKEREVSVVATVLANPTAKLPPNICTALAYAPEFWDDVEAREVAKGIKRAMDNGRPTHRAVVGRMCDKQYERWPYHTDFFTDVPLPIAIADLEAQMLIQRYANKRLVNLMANAYEQVLGRPEKARHVALELYQKLQVVL